LTRIEEALGLAQQTGEHWTDAYLHRIRGEILLKRDPANTAPAEEVFLSTSSLGFADSIMLNAAFTATSDMPLQGSLAALWSW
jgi:hypothetical protein